MVVGARETRSGSPYVDGGRLNAELDGGWTAELTADPALQAKATRILDRAKVPLAQLLCSISRMGTSSSWPIVMTRPMRPPFLWTHLDTWPLRACSAASIFKIVTAAGMHEAGLSMNRNLPFRPAKRRIDAQHLVKAVPVSRRPASDALVSSNNGFFARQANRLLSRADMVELSQIWFQSHHSIPG